MSTRITERERWVRLASMCIHSSNSQDYAVKEFDRWHAIVAAMQKIGRVTRVEVDGNHLILRARR